MATPADLPPVVYVAEIEREDGYNLSTGERWTGYRVRYRAAGSHGRWSTVLLVEQDQPPTVEQLQRICHAHATRGSR